jgi:hypothetical protein
MKFILEYKTFHKENEPELPSPNLVLINYWYNGMVTPVSIIEKRGNKCLVSHNVEQSKIRNAPDETVKTDDILPTEIKENPS